MDGLSRHSKRLGAAHRASAVAPCSANTLAKLANGMSDNLATCCLRAWDPAKPLIVAPAMNTVMWEHPATKLHLDTLQSWGCHIIPPASKTLACNDVGRGALAAEGDILQCVQVCNAPRSRDTAPSHPRDPRCACRCTTRVARVTCPRPRLRRMRLAQGLTVGTRARA
ncbi:MAG: flavoprotein, partial [Promethearchaeia archaeon]